MYLTKRQTVHRLALDQFLVINCLTGQMHLFSDEGILKFRSYALGFDPGDRKFENDLKSSKYLFDSPDEEEAYFLELCDNAKARLSKRPRSYMFVVNTLCNFACPYCFEAAELRAQNMYLTRDQIDSAFKIIRENTSRGDEDNTSLELFGGEPLLPASKDSLSYLLEQVARYGYKVAITTNGFSVDAFIPFLSKHAKHIRSAQITLDGLAAVHDRRRILRGGRGTFSRIVSNIDLLSKAMPNLSIHIRINIDKENADELERLAAFFAERGWDNKPQFTFTAAPVDNRGGTTPNTALIPWGVAFNLIAPLSRELGRGPYDLSIFKTLNHCRSYFGSLAQGMTTHDSFLPKPTFCPAAMAMLYVFHPDGRIYPCPETVGRTNFAIGRYFPKFSLAESQIEKWASHSVPTNPDCHSCDISTLCGGGCTLAAITNDRCACDDAKEVLTSYLSHLNAHP
jgi:uncharacterized protein